MVAPLLLYLGSALGAGLLGRSQARAQQEQRGESTKRLRNLLTPDLLEEGREAGPDLGWKKPPEGQGGLDLSFDTTFKTPSQRRLLTVGGEALDPSQGRELLSMGEDQRRRIVSPYTSALLDRYERGDPTANEQIGNILASRSANELGLETQTRSGVNTTESLWTTGKGENQKVFRELYVNGERFFDTPTGRLTYDQVVDTYGDILPTTAGGVSPGRGAFTSRKQFGIDVKDISDIDISLTNLEKYFRGVQNTNTGLKRLGDQITSAIKTLAGNKDYTNKEVLLGISNSRLQREIGTNRLAIVGGGVMTEKDAWRVIQGLGGDITALQNPEVLRQALRDMYEVNLRKRDNLIPLYNIGIDDLGYERDYKRRRKTGKYDEQTERYTYNHILDDIFGKEFQEKKAEDITDEIGG